MNAVVYKWFIDVQLHNILVSGPMVYQKAKNMALLDREDFRGGSGWLQRLKKRHKIAGKAVTGEN